MKPLLRNCSEPYLQKIKRSNIGAIFFDRDGTIIAEKHYLSSSHDLQLLPGAASSLKRLKYLKLPVYLITNQAGIAHGFFDEVTLNQIHYCLIAKLKGMEVPLKGILYCPHHPQAEIEAYRRNCCCRKPNPGLLSLAANNDGIALTKSYVVGDKLLDIQAGKNVGAKTILVLTGYGKVESQRIAPPTTPDFIATDLYEVVEWIKREEGRRQETGVRSVGVRS